MNVDTALLENPTVIAALVVVFLIELSLMVWALVDWIKRPAEQVRGNRIVWLLVLLLVNIVGPILYLTVARLPKQVGDSSSPLAGADAGSALDSLYGPTEGNQQ